MTNFLKKHYIIFVVVLLLFMLATEISSAMQKSQIIDESPHIAAGYSYLKTGDYRLNPEHPPLIKMMSGFPLLFIEQDSLDDNPGWQRTEQWYAGQYLLYHSSANHSWLLFWARLPNMLLSILLGLIIFKWAKALFGVSGGLFALLFYTFDPTSLAHSRWVTTDLGIAAFMVFALYFLSRYIKKPTLKRALVFAIVFGLALVAKFSAVILIPLVIIYLLINWWQRRPRVSQNLPEEGKRPFPIKGLILVTIIISFIVIWATYGFEVQKPFNDPEVSVAFAPGKSQQIFDKPWLQFVNQITDTETSIGKTTMNLAKTIPVPAYTYAKGFAVLANHNYWGHTSYLLGSFSKVGWWYYFIIAFLVKSPLITLIFTLLLLTLLIRWLSSLFRRSSYHDGGALNTLRNIKIDWFIIVLTPSLYFIWTLTSKLNLGVRHLLPVYPFLFIMFGYIVTLAWIKRSKITKTILAVLVLIYVSLSLAIYPHYLSYFNIAVGGPSQGYKYLTDSNLDWGQDLIALKDYMDENDLDNIYFHYFGTAEPEAYGIIHESPPTTEQLKPDFKGIVAISASGLYSENQDYKWLLDYEPIDRIGYSIYIYDIK
ncbi:glycosyltransferase family 39 protein [Patescibacteria group bacterium]|nr:glycosyltransferase family 39 protein [Patescibacteria group bacterium]MBU1890101.1 glycosyltransferase family 39 protein [Patescibacteria group bacterium]